MNSLVPKPVEPKVPPAGLPPPNAPEGLACKSTRKGKDKAITHRTQTVVEAAVEVAGAGQICWWSAAGLVAGRTQG
jgi:hypothetical protein